jgi:hypothetical protein
MARALWAIIAMAFVLWLIGITVGLGGAMIHLLLVVALIALVVNVVACRKTT